MAVQYQHSLHARTSEQLDDAVGECPVALERSGAGWGGHVLQVLGGDGVADRSGMTDTYTPDGGLDLRVSAAACLTTLRTSMILHADLTLPTGPVSDR